MPVSKQPFAAEDMPDAQYEHEKKEQLAQEEVTSHRFEIGHKASKSKKLEENPTNYEGIGKSIEVLHAKDDTLRLDKLKTKIQELKKELQILEKEHLNMRQEVQKIEPVKKSIEPKRLKKLIDELAAKDQERMDQENMHKKIEGEDIMSKKLLLGLISGSFIIVFFTTRYIAKHFVKRRYALKIL